MVDPEWHMVYIASCNKTTFYTRPNFIIKDLPSVLILKIADQISKCFGLFIGELYSLLLTILINMFEIFIILPEIFGIKPKPDYLNMKFGPDTLFSSLIRSLIDLSNN